MMAFLRKTQCYPNPTPMPIATGRTKNDHNQPNKKVYDKNRS